MFSLGFDMFQFFNGSAAATATFRPAVNQLLGAHPSGMVRAVALNAFGVLDANHKNIEQTQDPGPP